MKDQEGGNPVLMTPTNQLDRAHTSQPKRAAARLKECESGGYESGGDTESRQELLVGAVRMAREQEIWVGFWRK